MVNGYSNIANYLTSAQRYNKNCDVINNVYIYHLRPRLHGSAEIAGPDSGGPTVTKLSSRCRF